MTYSGTWTHSADADYFNNSKSYSNTTGYAETTFTGIRVFMKKDQSCGQLDLYLDNMTTPVATIDTYSATPTFQHKVYENLALAPGSHTIRVQVKA